jgi:polygalacturonase
MDFGAVGDGSNDDTAAIQAALNTGKYVYLPKGTYKTTSSLNVTVSSTGLYGEGQSSVIQPNFVSGDIFVIGDNTNAIQGLNFSNFLVWPSVVKTSGYVFNNRFVQNSRWENVFLGSLTVYSSHRLYDGYYFDRFGECTIACGQIIVAETAVKARGNADGSFGYELNLGDDVRILYATKGVWIGGGCGGIYFNRMDASVCTNGLYFDATLQAGIANREIFLNPGCTIDSCTEWGMHASGMWHEGIRSEQ